MTSTLRPYLALWVVTENPSDFPGLFVVRRHTIKAGQVVPDGNPSGTAKTLEGARAYIPSGLIKCPPSDVDDPVIKEYWV